MGIIQNGANTPLSSTPGTLPDVSGALMDWNQKVTFSSVTKAIEGFEVKETMESVTFRGNIQPNTNDLQILPNGQRVWESWELWAETALELDLDDVAGYNGLQLRVLKKQDWGKHGYRYYVLVEDWENNGPTELP